MYNVDGIELLQQDANGMEPKSIPTDNTETKPMSNYYHYNYELDAVHALVARYARDRRMIYSGSLCVTKAGSRIQRLSAMAEGSEVKPLGEGEFHRFQGKGIHREFFANVFYERVGEVLEIAGVNIKLPFECPDEAVDAIFAKLESQEFLESIDATLGVDGTVVYAEVEMLLTPLLIEKVHPIRVKSQQLLHRPDSHPIVTLFAGEGDVQEVDELIGTRRFSEALPTAVKSCKIQTNVVALTAVSQPHGMEIYKSFVRGDDVEQIKEVLNKGAAELAETVVDARRDGHVYDVIFEVAHWIDDDGALGWKLIGAAAYKVIAHIGCDFAKGESWTAIG